MRIFHGFDTLSPLRHPTVTVGSYDGVHVGHRALLAQLIEQAHQRDGESIVVTFEPHPRMALGYAEDMRLLTTLEQKCTLLEQLGVDNLIVTPFDATFRALSGEEFVRDYLIGRLGAEVLVAGYNHRFGHDRIACTALSKQLLQVVVVDECRAAGLHVSSTVIRNLLNANRIAEAERLLGYSIDLLKIRP